MKYKETIGKLFNGEIYPASEILIDVDYKFKFNKLNNLIKKYK